MSGFTTPEGDAGVFHVINSFVGSAIQLPLAMLRPGGGYLDAYCGYFGSLAQNGLDFASLTVGPGVTNPVSIFSKGITQFVGAHSQTGMHLTTGTHMCTGALFTSTCAVNTITGKTNTITGMTTIAGKSCSLAAASTHIAAAKMVTITGAKLTSVQGGRVMIKGRDWSSSSRMWDAKKSFDIPHPSKEDHRLRYICVEGPTADVYHRGRLKGSNTIELPYYWKDLVHEDSITVQLQPIGMRHFHLNVVQFDNEKIIVADPDDKPIDCFYTVFAERKDTSKNIPEYRGLTEADYPGDNEEYIINGG